MRTTNNVNTVIKVFVSAQNNGTESPAEANALAAASTHCI